MHQDLIRRLGKELVEHCRRTAFAAVAVALAPNNVKRAKELAEHMAEVARSQ
ncbi:MAG: hypothetical protein GY788_21000 [bacterium]|nr:hypothetical protein [bacterium]